jgi:hypothetical protein
VDTSNFRPVLPIVSYESVPSVKLVRHGQIVTVWRVAELSPESRSEVERHCAVLCLGSGTL